MEDMLYDKLPYSSSNDSDAIMDDEAVVETHPYHVVDTNFNSGQNDTRSSVLSMRNPNNLEKVLIGIRCESKSSITDIKANMR